MKIYQLLKIDDNDVYFETQRLVKISNDLDSFKSYLCTYYELNDCKGFGEIDECFDDYPQYLYGNHYVSVTHFDI